MSVRVPTDDELLRSDDPEAFGVFFDRHHEAVLGSFARRTFEPEEAEALTAETFAVALAGRRRFRAPAKAWLSAIAARRLADYQRTGHVGERMRRALAIESRDDLREALVEAAARERGRGRAARVARRLHPRAWSRGVVAGVATALAASGAVAIGLRADGPAAPEIVRSIYIGGQPRDATAVGDRLVIADQDGSLAAIVPGEPGKRRELDVSGTPLSVAADGDALWVVTQAETIPRGTRVTERAGPALTHLVKLDVRSGRTLARIPVRDVAEAVRAGAAGVWLPSYLGLNSALEGLPRPSRGIPVRIEEQVAVGERSAWLRRSAAVYAFDAAGRRLGRADGVAPTLAFESQRSILPDADGAWVVGQTSGRLHRIERGRVTRRIRVGDTAGVVARAGNSVWVSAASGRGGFELVRVDRDSGKVIGRVGLGRAAPRAIVPTGGQLWVVTSGGDALLVNPG